MRRQATEIGSLWLGDRQSDPIPCTNHDDKEVSDTDVVSTLTRRWRRWYMSWFARHGVRVCAGTAVTWMIVVYTASLEHQWWAAGAGFTAAVGSCYAGLILNDNPADPDDPGEDFF